MSNKIHIDPAVIPQRAKEAPLFKEQEFEYHVEIIGGRGDQLWDNQMIMRATSLLECAKMAHEEAERINAWVTLIEQRTSYETQGSSSTSSSW